MSFPDDLPMRWVHRYATSRGLKIEFNTNCKSLLLNHYFAILFAVSGTLQTTKRLYQKPRCRLRQLLRQQLVLLRLPDAQGGSNTRHELPRL